MTTRPVTPDTSARLPDGYSMRPPAFADLAAVVALFAACDLHDHGEADETEETVGDYWRPIALEDEARIVLDGEDRIVGYGDQAKRNPVRLGGFVCVDPDRRGRGIGIVLTEWVESRAAQRIHEAPEGTKVRLQFGMAAENRGATDLLDARGYAFERSFQRMVIELEEPPPAPEWPPGLHVRAYRKGPDDRATWQAAEEAFDDHWGNVRSSFEEWSKMFARDSFDPSLWFLAVEGEELAAPRCAGIATRWGGSGRSACAAPGGVWASRSPCCITRSGSSIAAANGEWA